MFFKFQISCFHLKLDLRKIVGKGRTPCALCVSPLLRKVRLNKGVLFGMENRVRKGSWTGSPLFGVFVGIVIVVVYIAFENAVTPAGYALLGGWWSLVKTLGFWLFMGAVIKLWIWRVLPRSLSVEPMTAAQFAGATEDAAQAAIRERAIRAPLPSPLPSPVSAAAPKAMLSLDFAAFENRATELQAIGFDSELQGAMKTNVASAAPTFAHFFKHSEGARAEIFQAFPRGAQPTIVNVTIISYLDDNWSILDGNTPRNWLLWMLRRPRSLGKGYDPDTTVVAMWQQHRERVATASRELGVGLMHLNLDVHLERSIEAVTEGRRFMLFRSMLLSMIQNRFFRSAEREWWGDYFTFAKN